MAIYRLSADIVRRSAGRTVTAAAAYRAGMQIVDARTGLVFDYRRRHGVLHAAIIAPLDAPAWMRERAQLWNGVERGEKRKDAQLARDIELALPHELTHAERRDLVHGFVQAAFVDAGMVADVAMHAPDREGDQRNHHAHILLTMRAIDGDSFGDKVREWNKPGCLEQWRALWAEHVNAALVRAGTRAHVDHRSLEAQGIDRLPQIHLGRPVIEMHRRGITTERAEIAREIAAVNVELAASSETAGEAVQTRERAAASIMLRQTFRGSTAPQRARAPTIDGPGLSKLFRRLAHVITVGIWRVMPVPRRSPTIAPMIESRAPT